MLLINLPFSLVPPFTKKSGIFHFWTIDTAFVTLFFTVSIRFLIFYSIYLQAAHCCYSYSLARKHADYKSYCHWLLFLFHFYFIILCFVHISFCLSDIHIFPYDIQCRFIVLRLINARTHFFCFFFLSVSPEPPSQRSLIPLPLREGLCFLESFLSPAFSLSLLPYFHLFSIQFFSINPNTNCFCDILFLCRYSFIFLISFPVPILPLFSYFPSLFLACLYFWV